ncbi:Retrovirus-related Pol polyprotein from transposon RE1 [Vitis vinifera]|uniref:Retrovirus-related Pol polyprotein from transposon RE1 n=1 Tax=Vitis vinifera TaxID=29760 RepID=A0A438GGD9_VITVI|nr:Retrovirus-related Pol polyprotein from transposon RE1 [Vitis vinifera]
MVVQQQSPILRQALILISQPSNALTAIRLIPPIWISHNFKATTLGMTKKTMRNRGFEPWTFRSCLGYQHFVINDNNRDQRKKDSKKTSIATVAEIKTKANVAKKASTLVTATDHGANGNTTPVIGEGSLTLTDTLNLDSILVVPSLDYNLLSVSQITAALSCIVIFWPEFCVIKDIQTRQTIGCGIKRGKLCYLGLQSKDSNKLQQALMANGSEGEKKKMTWLCLMKTKDEVNLLFQNFHKMIETRYNTKVWVLRSDNGGEYQSSDLQKYLEGHGIIHQTTCSNTPQQNGVAERKNRHLLEGEYHKEIQTLDYDYHISKENESGQSELVNQEMGELDMSGQQFGFEDVFTEIPNQSSSVEGVLNLEPDPFMKWLPHRHNRAIPNSVQEALADPRWKAVMNEEMKSLQKNETWELVECPPGKKPVGCRWIYTVKYKADGSIERFKAKLVAKGYTQTYGIDYTETFAPVAKINIVRVLLSLAANLDWPLQQFDVKNAFLHGELSEEVYMDLPLGCMVSEKQCQKVCKLKKSLYGLKQSSRAWFGRFTKSMRAFGYRQRNDPEERKALQNYLFREFKMKDLDLLQETGMSGCQPVNTPIEEGLKLCDEPNQVSTDKGRYQRLVGRLMYLAHTRPDLAYALNVSIKVYTDADWAGVVDDRRSTSGYFTFVGGNLVTWKSYLSRQPIRLFCDNKVACDIAHNPVQHDRTKHVEVDRFFIKEKLDDKIVELPKIRSEDQLADILTKAISSQVFSKILDKLGMCDIYVPT